VPNRLIHEKSPYLLQHAHNPVDWYPWGEEAFARARAEHRPIFLSVGYATCHWCHVMEHESFESERIAAILNRSYVAIKVDREERPDIDRVYMTALQSIGEHGGWPMSMFLTPELKPFFGGTYFPPETRYGRIGFGDLLDRIHEAWTADRDNVLASADAITEHLRGLASASRRGGMPDASVLDAGFEAFAGHFDAPHGGFGGAPKFPRPAVFAFLLRHSRSTRDPRGTDMTATSLHRMSAGGVYDHVGGGFHRYAVDAAWRVPHFEKMLYDQAQLVPVFLDTYLLTGDDRCRRVAREVLDYVLRDMTGPGGEFFSAEDADSSNPDTGEAGEGAFYVWSLREFLTHLGEKEGRACARHYGVLEEGNVEHDPQGEFIGKNILYEAINGEEIPAQARAKLLAVRSQRPRPLRDDKVITAWNGLMISAFARAGRVLRAPAFTSAAERNAAWVLSHLHDRSTGRLFRRWRDGEARFAAHLDDYAFLVQGLLDLYETSFDIEHLRAAVALTATQLKLFRDGATGVFFDTAGEDASVLVRSRELYDGAEPSGSAIAAMNLLRLGHMTGNREYRLAAEGAVAAAGDLLSRQPDAAPAMLSAFHAATGAMQEIVIVGKREQEGTQALLQEVHARYLPDAVVLLADPEDRGELSSLAPFTAALQQTSGLPTAFVCRDFTCRLPVTAPGDLVALLNEG
jgi:uncharacterized protein